MAKRHRSASPSNTPRAKQARRRLARASPPTASPPTAAPPTAPRGLSTLFTDTADSLTSLGKDARVKIQAYENQSLRDETLLRSGLNAFLTWEPEAGRDFIETSFDRELYDIFRTFLPDLMHRVMKSRSKAPSVIESPQPKRQEHVETVASTLHQLERLEEINTLRNGITLRDSVHSRAPRPFRTHPQWFLQDAAPQFRIHQVKIIDPVSFVSEEMTSEKGRKMRNDQLMMRACGDSRDLR
ncbi:hypothetical protein N7527_003017 [Penicillium freii]|nr:hypothetical protein N7527_003017 [Penicillium freii]